MPDPTLESVLLQRAQHIGPDPMAGPITSYPGAQIGQMPFAGAPGKLTGLFKGVVDTPTSGHSLTDAAQEIAKLGVAKAAGIPAHYGRKIYDFTQKVPLSQAHPWISSLLPE